MSWEFKNGIPIYQQIILRLKTDIAAGVIRPGDRMPAVRELALEAGVNPNTMQRALAQLEAEHILYTVRTSGRYVTEEIRLLEEMRVQLAEEHIRALFETLEALGMSRGEIADAVKGWKEKE